MLANLDGTMIGQAVTNLLKNAAEAIEERLADPDLPHDPGEIRVALHHDPAEITIDIMDNGRGLPDEAVRLYEPYVTHRQGGTGLGLSIVKKIVEEHDGSLDLRPATPFGEEGHAGAWARITLPLLPATPRVPEDATTTGPREGAGATSTGKSSETLRESI